MEAGAGREGGGASDSRGLETCPLSPLQKFEGEFLTFEAARHRL